jgi:hypothetical protein
VSALTRKPTVAHVLALSWLITWVLTVPLFHIHALDAQEDRSLSQTVLPHTVFSPDLPGEYAPRTAVHRSGTPENQHTLSIHFQSYSEIAIGLFNDDDNKKWKDRLQPVVYLSLHAFSQSYSLPESVRHVIPRLTSPPLLLLGSPAPSRAPPFVTL